jgi:hypothetical protein
MRKRGTRVAEVAHAGGEAAPSCAARAFAHVGRSA